LTIWLAVLAIYFIDFAINAGMLMRLNDFTSRLAECCDSVMAIDRALLVDSLPSPQQTQGNAWAARMGITGALFGFFVYVLLLTIDLDVNPFSQSGNVDLTKIFPFFGKTQLQVLSVLASLLLMGSHLTMAIFVKEKILISTTDVAGLVGHLFANQLT
jgi:solute carrier family 45 protein 1/2/4